LRQLGLAGTVYAKAQSTTIRVKLLKIGARIRITVRKVWLSFSEAYPYADAIVQILANLQRYPARKPPVITAHRNHSALKAFIADR
jgi:hypothetical protein